MDLYRSHYISIRKEDTDKVDEILRRHDAIGDLDDVTACSVPSTDGDGNVWITYRIRPYISEDLEIILSEFKEAGIQVR